MATHSSLLTNCCGNATDYYPSVLQEEALARLAYLAAKNSACGLLLGPDGSGKTLALSRFADQQRKSGAAVASVSAIGTSPVDLLLTIGAAWGADVRMVVELPQLWQRTTDRLRVLSFEQVPAILLVDDLDQARDDVAVLVDRLQSYAEGNSADLVLIATTDDRCLGLLSPRLLCRVELRIEFDAWTQEESSGFLQQWLAQHGGGKQEFDNQALEVLHDLAEGIPRRVRQLAELTLLAGSESNERHLSEGIVTAAYEELSIGR